VPHCIIGKHGVLRARTRVSPTSSFIIREKSLLPMHLWNQNSLSFRQPHYSHTYSESAHFAKLVYVNENPVITTTIIIITTKTTKLMIMMMMTTTTTQHRAYFGHVCSAPIHPWNHQQDLMGYWIIGHAIFTSRGKIIVDVNATTGVGILSSIVKCQHKQ